MPTEHYIDNEHFGSRLREAREQAGYDVETLARRLHIRVDIVKAIEASDFHNIPASGYAKNMIRSYARTVGLNQNEIGEQYLREMESYERSKSTSKRAQIREINTSIRGRGDREASRRFSSRERRSSRENVGQERRRSSRRGAGTSMQKTTKSMSSSFALGSLPKPSVPSVDRGGLVKIGIVAVIVILIIVIAILLFGRSGQKSEEIPTMPISGLTDTSNQATTDSQTQNATTKTKATFQFSVESGSRSYCTVTLDGVSQFADVAEGPTSKTYEVTGVLVFSTANPDPVTVKLDNNVVELTVDSTSGYYTYTYDFAAENAAAVDATTNTSGSSTSTSSTNTSNSSSASMSATN